ncbi:MAG TPA: hypothetical protein VMJ31_10340 [Methylocystis sp.]|nr:hypothetical protein [Methylocystis sp.]
MTGSRSLVRRRLTRGVASAGLLILALGSAHAEDSQSLFGRAKQWFGLGADANKGQQAQPPAPKTADTPPPAPKADETSAQSPPEGTYIPGANAVILGAGPVQSRVLKMLGIGNDAAAGDAPAEAAKKAQASGITECPDIVVDGAGAEMRSPADADASSVSYQLSITRMARECALAGENVSMRVGVLGAAMLGPVGKPGDYFGTLRVAVRRKNDNRLFGEKTYRVGATIPANHSRADFTLLVEDLSAPFVNAKAAEDYEILVGFKKGEAGDATKKRAKKKAGG